ncbi:glutamate-5-semialdehyde dehydrogenase [Radiomyces spectabilis]|uniref:glutamate-5-semialdehyde dehydrogenase n=1 Tax=Radiomyces spectabilis TaxID=64574 RepID=UPI00221F6CCA|nr:glutamate-5-semialdehyde dehydrogenase [Radiomyces spectabilis]KAI8390976.1 glutamate-5-semialdehyde dehydrogenase [Radiomyces spectabilis]
MSISSSPVTDIARAARLASVSLQSVTNEQKNEALLRIKQVLAERKDEIFKANEEDKKLAEEQVKAGKLSSSLFKRLDICNGDKFETILSGVSDITKLDDPTKKVTLATKLDTDLQLYRVSVPVGVLLTIFEARPEVVVNISCLALKSGNAVILKGGKEATHTNAVLARVIQDALASLSSSGIPKTAVQIVETREDISALLEQDRYIDMVVPRGSNSLVKYIQNNTRIPVLGHADGICSVYIDKDANIAKAARISVDAKTNYPAACNAAETLLVHRSLLQSDAFKTVAQALLDANVTLKCEAEPKAALAGLGSDKVVDATEDDFYTEFLDHTMAVKVVADVNEAVEHINEHGSKHTDAIVTENGETADFFMTRVDAAGCYWNASTRFADGFRYGFGAEVGVSTNKTHARGPVGLEGLVIYKYRAYGNGNVAGDYGSGKKQYLHEPINASERIL